ncbi:MAG: mandelate racemase/muconate lactonizing enzyme family protein [Phycisphaerales bacterium]|nr:MAG: mandelate racemase/muconate lactonizing enzyme family protein [Phycisphaerales bacterium]
MDRRKFLAAAGSMAAIGTLLERPGILNAAPQATTELGRVKIRDVKTATVRIKYDAHLVKVTTDSGLYGIGEAYNRDGVVSHIHSIKRQIIGQDPLQVDYLWHKMMDAGVGQGSRSGSLTGAISGIETALWDLAGKILNVPVYTLLGGKFRDKLLIYHDTGSPNATDPRPWVEEAQRSKAYGFKAMKFDLNRFSGERWNRSLSSNDMKAWVKILEAIRRELGPDFPLGVDFHWALNTREAMRFAQMVEHLNLWFLEDPMPPENADAFARLTAMSKVPIATGENLFTRQTFRPYIEKQACDIVQPDTQKCGGLLEAKRIADWADLYYINMLCHNMCTPVGTIASGHACMAIRSFLALESDSVELPYWQDIVQREGSLYKDGYLEIPNKPGLGVELNEAVCRKHLAEGTGFFD